MRNSVYSNPGVMYKLRFDKLSQGESSMVDFISEIFPAIDLEADRLYRFTLEYKDKWGNHPGKKASYEVLIVNNWRDDERALRTLYQECGGWN